MEFIEKKKIGSCEYAVTKLMARDAIRLGTKIGSVVAPFVGSLTGAESLEAALGEAVGQLFTRPDLQATLDYCNAVLGEVTEVTWTDKDGPRTKSLKPEFLDVHFRGRLDEWVEWLIFALRVNLSSFSHGVLQLGTKLRENAKAAKVKQPTDSEKPSGSQNESERTG